MTDTTPPLVSVCIDVYNYADYLPQAIESVLNQTLTDFELIITDDCSEDASFAVAQRYAGQDPRVRVSRNSANMGMVRNRNVCLNHARGRYVKWLHADDFLASPEALERLTALMESNPALALAASAMRFVDADGRPTGAASFFSGARLISGTTVIARCLWEQKNLVGGPSAVMFRRNLSGRGFDERFFHAADLEMWFHLLEQGCFGYIPDALTGYRWHGRQQTEQDKKTLTQADDQRALLETYLDKPYVRFRPWMKDALRHDAVRQTLRRCRTLGQRAAAGDALRAHGESHYRRQTPLCFLLRKARKLAPALLPNPLPPFDRPPVSVATRLPLGINVAGFFKGEYGIGESSRAFGRAAQATGLPCALINIHSKDHRNLDASLSPFSERNPYGVNLMTFSFDYARRFFQDRGPRFFRDHYNIALWYWELERFPARWHSNFDFYDELWVPTDFCREAFAAVSPIPVRKITYPLRCEDAPAPDRARFGLTESARVFLFTFDHHSVIERKNPLGVIEAFRRAFGASDDAVLVLKSINAAHNPRGQALIQQAVQGLNVRHIEAHLTGAEMTALLTTCDCYVSLHRSEGLGLDMAQAMALGKPVIATGYSGNLEFMNAGNSLLVNSERAELTDDYGPYGKGNVWAEPSLDHAAELMRGVYAYPDGAARLGDRAQSDIQASLNPAATARQIRERLQDIGKEGRTS